MRFISEKRDHSGQPVFDFLRSDNRDFMESFRGLEGMCGLSNTCTGNAGHRSCLRLNQFDERAIDVWIALDIPGVL